MTLLQSLGVHAAGFSSLLMAGAATFVAIQPIATAPEWLLRVGLGLPISLWLAAALVGGFVFRHLYLSKQVARAPLACAAGGLGVSISGGWLIAIAMYSLTRLLFRL